MDGDYCTDVEWRTSCLQNPMYCRQHEIYHKSCEEFQEDCELEYNLKICDEISGTECDWLDLGLRACKNHPTGPTTKDWSEDW